MHKWREFKDQAKWPSEILKIGDRKRAGLGSWFYTGWYCSLHYEHDNALFTSRWKSCSYGDNQDYSVPMYIYIYIITTMYTLKSKYICFESLQVYVSLMPCTNRNILIIKRYCLIANCVIDIFKYAVHNGLGMGRIKLNHYVGNVWNWENVRIGADKEH